MNSLTRTAALRIAVASLFFICCHSVQAQNIKIKNASTSRQNDARKYAALITPAGLKSRLAVLSADSMEGRETGEIGARRAAAYIASRFKSIGLKQAILGSWFQTVPLISQELNAVSLQVGTLRPHYLKDYVYVPSQNGNSNLVRAGSITIFPFPASAEEMARNLESKTLKDKVVLLIPTNSTAIEFKDVSSYLRSINRILGPLRRKSPAAILLCDEKGSTFGGDSAFYQPFLQNKTIIPADNKDTHPAASLLLINNTVCADILTQGGTDLERVTKILTTKGSSYISTGISMRIINKETKVDAANVLGLLPGKDLKSEVLVISAHYDHLGYHNGKIYHGADDDGSGTSAILEIAAAFAKAKKAGNGPRRSILFLANVGEEKGLLGSQYYSQHPVISVEKTITDLNIDMIGRIDSAHLKDTNYVYVIGSGKLSSQLQEISESVNHKFGDLDLDYRFDDPQDPNQFYYRSDHYNFAKLNIPIIFYFNGVHADYHQPSDTIEKIVFGLYAKRARLVFYTAWELANIDKRPVVDRVSDFK